MGGNTETIQYRGSGDLGPRPWDLGRSSTPDRGGTPSKEGSPESFRAPAISFRGPGALGLGVWQENSPARSSGGIGRRRERPGFGAGRVGGSGTLDRAFRGLEPFPGLFLFFLYFRNVGPGLDARGLSTHDSIVRDDTERGRLSGTTYF